MIILNQKNEGLILISILKYKNEIECFRSFKVINQNTPIMFFNNKYLTPQKKPKHSN